MEENNNFFDKNTLLAVGLSIVFFLGWQAYLQKTYPDSYKKTEQQTAKSPTDKMKSQDTKTEVSETKKSTELSTNTPAPENTVASEKNFDVQTNLYDLSLSSKGMGFSYFELKKFSDRKNNNIRFEDPSGAVNSFATYYNGEAIDFEIEKKGDYHFVGSAQVGNQTLMKEMIFNPENYTFSVKLKTIAGTPLASDKIEMKLSNKVLKVKSSMFRPAYEGTEFFSINDGGEEREKINIEKKLQQNFDKTTLTAIGTHYFAMALSDRSDVIPSSHLVFSPDKQVAYATVSYPAASTDNKTNIEFTGFVGPKKYDILKNLDPNLVKMINYGMFGVLSKPMLSLLKWLYSMFKNWGLAIIFLTIFIRLLLLPINISSLKSMKKMQKIQPQLKAIKEKYKDNPQMMNQETMALMKKEKANPLGGCLPMLLQLPVFFALYSVLGQSVELYKSPFIFWIKDLSYQDPFFVLPIAVGALYFVQMSITPQPTDPAQAKIMKFVPILFCFFMITVPSGLTLYFFVNTVFGIGQSFIFQREKKKAVA